MLLGRGGNHWAGAVKPPAGGRGGNHWAGVVKRPCGVGRGGRVKRTLKKAKIAKLGPTD